MKFVFLILLFYILLVTSSKGSQINESFDACVCNNELANEEPCINNRCILKHKNQRCYSSLENGHRGCVNEEKCYTHERPFSGSLLECCKGNLCNKKLDHRYVLMDEDGVVIGSTVEPTSKTTESKKGSLKLSNVQLAAIISAPFALLFIALSVWILLQDRRRKKTAQQADDCLVAKDRHRMGLDQLNLHELTSSGSGAGLPLLVQRTIARQIVLHEVIGTGRFGNVYRGSWHEQNVAVKIFMSNEEGSWFREAQIYQTTMLRHENVLGFIAADNKDTGSCTELWLVTEFHSNGSLYDFLQENVLNIKELFTMVFNIANGLAHLHMEVIGTEGKPAMAHRDIKTKNILVKANKTCCIADLGLTVLHTSVDNKVDIPTSSRTGTTRYQSPELLDNDINLRHFDSYRRADMYSFGLSVWEICRRTDIDGQVEKYQLPYFDCVQPDPSHEDMQKVVCVEGKRPFFPEYMQRNEKMKSLLKIMKECWYHEGAARLTSLRVKKDLLPLCRSMDIDI